MNELDNIISSLIVVVVLPLFVIIFFIGSFPSTWKSLKQQKYAHSNWRLFLKVSGIVLLKIIFLVIFFLIISWIFSYAEGDFFTFIIFILVVILGSILERSASWWAGGVIGYFIGMIIGLVKGFFWTGIIYMVGLGILGLLFDYAFSKRVVE